MGTSPKSHDDPDEPNGPRDSGRYVALDMNERQTVVYDAEVETAWIQSDTAVELDNIE